MKQQQQKSFTPPWHTGELENLLKLIKLSQVNIIAA